MTFEVSVKRSALKFIKELSKEYKERILEVVNTLKREG